MGECCKGSPVCKHLCGQWVLRLAFAAVFIYHGLGKFPKAPGMAEMMGMDVAMIYLVAVLEALGGVLVLAGGFGTQWMSKLGGLFIAPIMVVAILKYHWGQWSFAPSETHPMGGVEFQVVLLALALYFMCRGKEA